MRVGEAQRVRCRERERAETQEGERGGLHARGSRRRAPRRDGRDALCLLLACYGLRLCAWRSTPSSTVTRRRASCVAALLALYARGAACVAATAPDAAAATTPPPLPAVAARL